MGSVDNVKQERSGVLEAKGNTAGCIWSMEMPCDDHRKVLDILICILTSSDILADIQITKNAHTHTQITQNAHKRACTHTPKPPQTYVHECVCNRVCQIDKDRRGKIIMKRDERIAYKHEIEMKEDESAESRVQSKTKGKCLHTKPPFTLMRTRSTLILWIPFDRT